VLVDCALLPNWDPFGGLDSFHQHDRQRRGALVAHGQPVRSPALAVPCQVRRVSSAAEKRIEARMWT
jgi:hypothetical protein